MKQADQRHLYSRAEDWTDEPGEALPGMSVPGPRFDKDLIAHWEWWLWTLFRTEHEPDRMLGKEFWADFIGCEVLMNHCRLHASLSLHHYLNAFFYYSALFKKSPFPQGVFPGTAQLERDQDVATIRRLARKDLKRLTKMQMLIKELAIPDFYDCPDEYRFQLCRRSVEGEFAPLLDPDSGVQTLKMIVDLLRAGAEGASQRTLRRPVVSTRFYTKAYPFPPVHPLPPTGTGKGADRNLFYLLVAEMLRPTGTKEYPWAHAFAVLKHFTPALLEADFVPRRPLDDFPNEIAAKQLRDRVKKFRSPKNSHHTHVKKCVTLLRKWVESPASQVCPAPDFLTF